MLSKPALTRNPIASAGSAGFPEAGFRGMFLAGPTATNACSFLAQLGVVLKWQISIGQISEEIAAPLALEERLALDLLDHVLRDLVEVRASASAAASRASPGMGVRCVVPLVVLVLVRVA